MCTVYRNRMIFLCLCIWIVLAVPISFIDVFFAQVGIDDEVAQYAVRYLGIIYPFYCFEIVS